jgi:tRNA threonylcarbamoyladenosine biosynthesis protein TsaE
METAAPIPVTDTPLDEQTRDLADAAATRSLGRWLAQALEGRGRDQTEPALLLLQGDLGAGKTCLVQGLAEGLAIPEPVTSPSFALAQHYAGTAADGRATRLVHLDLYRLEQPAAADELFSQEEEEARIAAVSTRVVMAVEWPERLSFQPEGAWLLRLEHRGDGRRASWRAT